MWATLPSLVFECMRVAKSRDSTGLTFAAVIIVAELALLPAIVLASAAAVELAPSPGVAGLIPTARRFSESTGEEAAEPETGVVTASVIPMMLSFVVAVVIAMDGGEVANDDDDD